MTAPATDFPPQDALDVLRSVPHYEDILRRRMRGMLTMLFGGVVGMGCLAVAYAHATHAFDHASGLVVVAAAALFVAPLVIASAALSRVFRVRLGRPLDADVPMWRKALGLVLVVPLTVILASLADNDRFGSAAVMLALVGIAGIVGAVGGRILLRNEKGSTLVTVGAGAVLVLAALIVYALGFRDPGPGGFAIAGPIGAVVLMGVGATELARS